MAFSLLNGLSTMGSGTAAWAAQAGLEQQKSDLEDRTAILASQLAQGRETAGRTQAGQIAATAAGAEHTFQSGLETQRETAAQTLQSGQIGSTEKIAAAAQTGETGRQATSIAAATALETQKENAPTQLERDLKAAGLQPGSPEYERAMFMSKGVPMFGALSGLSTAGGGANGGQTMPTGDAFLKTLDPSVAATVKAIGEGRQPPLTGMAMKSPYGQQMMAAVNQAYPGYQGQDYAVKLSAEKGFVGGGVDAKFIDSANSLGGHLDTLSKLADSLKNGDLPLFNKVANSWAANTGSSVPTNFDTAKNIVGGEIVKAIVGAGGGEGDRAKAQAAFNAASSPEQLQGAIQTATNIFHTQVEARELKYQQTTGKSDFGARLTPQARQTFGVADPGQTGGPSAPSVPGGGVGSQGNPIVPKSQSDIDNAPSGSYIQGPSGIMRKP